MTIHVFSGRRHGKSLFQLFAYAGAHGWTVSRTNGGHLRFSKAGRQPVHTSSTPSDWRSVRNALATLARADRRFASECEEAEEVALG
ncbi:hypothetical protein DN826_21565 [Stutzerimonas nosocomialis]|uniref:hypothetical protein n=1 Tax=Stutzerimonas nosocomialis TaxID=1056496 RepID=UPI001107B17F|nr:hypothetical protein [Stutzerimonas nosocomialis]TLX52835.1 hypothetical protein DN826_21565 [Stutzerimonas nosocomialis]